MCPTDRTQPKYCMRKDRPMEKDIRPVKEYPEGCIDPWCEIPLTPSFHGEMYLGNGEHPGLECCCDACDYYLACFPDWSSFLL